MKIKKKLRDVTEEEYLKWADDNCRGKCNGCLFKTVRCNFAIEDIWANNKDLFSDKFLDQEIEIEVEKPKPTKEEIAFLKMLKPEWKWIAKVESGYVYIFQTKPEKTKIGYWMGDHSCNLEFLPYKFDFLSWKDEEPTNIQELIKEYDDEK